MDPAPTEAVVAPLARLDAPIPASWSVRQGRDAYLAENGFPLADYDAVRTPASLLGVKFSVPNTPAHRRAIMQHDLHHVATGYGTDPTGEGEISAWEARSGMGPLDLYVSGLVLTGVVLGVLIAPLRTLAAWRAARSARGLFALDDADYEALLSLSVAELRARLGVPVEGLVRRPRRLHSTAPSRALRLDAL
jgi:hypothetical protein